jgi:nucleoside-diphosphate-sugar epimerase
MIKKILVLGGSGYLGHSLAKRFEQEDDVVMTVADLKKPLNAELEFVEVDVLNGALVSAIIKEHDVIINCTGQITTPIDTCFRINTAGIDNIGSAVASHNKKLFHISTVAVYGTKEYADEHTAMNPESPYGACKSFAEYRITQHLSKEMFCVLRLPNLYSENQPRGLFAYLLKSYRSDRKLHFNNDGTLTRYFIHVDDCAEAIALAVRRELRGTFNVPSTVQYELNEIISLVENGARVHFEKQFDRVKPIENIKKLNCNAFYEEIGFSPKRSLTEFINKTFSRHA